MTENKTSRKIVTATMKSTERLAAQDCLSLFITFELIQAGCKVQRQLQCPIRYKDTTLATPLRIDLLVNDTVVVECKAVTQYNAIFATKILTYLRLRNIKLGLVINFGEKLVKDGIHRVVNGL